MQGVGAYGGRTRGQASHGPGGAMTIASRRSRYDHFNRCLSTDSLACGMYYPALNLLADASVQVAATAHWSAMEGYEE